MPHFRLCFLPGEMYHVNIDEQLTSLERFRRTIEDRLPAGRSLDDYFCFVSGKPTHQLNLHDEQDFDQRRTLITDRCFIWMKAK